MFLRFTPLTNFSVNIRGYVMNVQKLKENNPEIEFYELKEEPKSNAPCLAKIEDLFYLSKKIGYIETKFSSEDATNLCYEVVIDFYKNNLDFDAKRSFDLFLSERPTEDIRLLCKCQAYTSLKLFGLDLQVRYYEDKSVLDQVDVEKIFQVLDELYDNFLKEKRIEFEKAKQEKEEKIQKLIFAYRNKYNNAETKKEKEAVIREVQMNLKKEFDMDGRSDYRASKAYIISEYIESL